MLSRRSHRAIARGFRQLAPWVTRFEIDGRRYGGKYDPRSDPRMTWFLEGFPQARTILDLGSLEGAQSFILAEGPSVERVLGLEARPPNIRKAEFVRDLLGVTKVSFRQADLETQELDVYGRFDAVFCAGLLYHLPEPWRLIEQISRVTKNLFIWTHFAPDESADQVINGYQGTEYKEFGWRDPQSGVSPKSFWPTFDSLMKMVGTSGFNDVTLIEKGPAEPGPVTAFLARASQQPPR